MNDLDLLFYQCGLRKLIDHFLKHQWTDKHFASWKKWQLQQPAEHPWHTYGMQPGVRAGGHRGMNIPSGTLSISKVRRSMCINKENLTLILLCSDDSLQTVWLRPSLTTQEFSPLSCLNGSNAWTAMRSNCSQFHQKLFPRFVTMIPHFFFKRCQTSPKNKMKVVLSRYTR